MGGVSGKREGEIIIATFQTDEIGIGEKRRDGMFSIFLSTCLSFSIIFKHQPYSK